MSLVIWKQQLRPGLNVYQLPRRAKLLSVGWQQGQPMLWFQCSPGETLREIRKILLTGTGHDFPENDYRFIGTMLTPDQAFVFHVLEAVDPERPVEP